MANFEAVTAGEAVEPVKSATKLQKLIDQYSFGGLRVEVDNGYLEIYGYDWFEANAESEQNTMEDATEDFLKKVAKHLRGPLIIQSIGSEKCRFPLCASQITVTPDGKIEYKGF